MRLLPRRLRRQCRLLLVSGGSVAALVELMNLCQLAACLAPRGSSNIDKAGVVQLAVCKTLGKHDTT